MKQLFIFLLIAGCVSAIVNSPPLVSPQRSDPQLVEAPETNAAEVVDAKEEIEAPAPNDEVLIFAEVTEVLDGNTVNLLDDLGQSRTVDLFGIDAPKRPPFGRDATNVLKHYTLGKRVLLQARGTDKYGQDLGVLSSTDGESISLKLLSLGMASHNVEHSQSESYAEIEEIAKRAGVGIWARARPMATLDDRSGTRVEVAESISKPTRSQTDVIVYVTQYGHKYHRSGCKHLAKSKQAIPLSRAKRIYGPCENCRPPY